MEIDSTAGKGQISWIRLSSDTSFETWQDLLDGKILVNILSKVDSNTFISSRLVDVSVHSESEKNQYLYSNLFYIYTGLSDIWSHNKFSFIEEEFFLNLDKMIQKDDFEEMTRFMALILLSLVSLTNNDQALKQLMATQEISNKDEAVAVENQLSNQLLPFYEKITTNCGVSDNSTMQTSTKKSSNDIEDIDAQVDLLNQIENYEMKIKELEKEIGRFNEEYGEANEKSEMLISEGKIKDIEIGRLGQSNEEFQTKLNYFITQNYEEKLKEQDQKIVKIKKEYENKQVEESQKLDKKDQEMNDMRHWEFDYENLNNTFLDYQKKMDDKDREQERFKVISNNVQKKDTELMEIKNTLDIETQKCVAQQSTIMKESDQRRQAESKVDNHRQEITTLQRSNEEAESKLENLQQRVDELENQKDSSTNPGSELDNLGRELTSYFEIIKKKENEVEVTNVTELESPLKRDTFKFAQEIESFYTRLTNLQNNYRNHNENYTKSNQELSDKIQDLQNEISEQRKENTQLNKSKNESEKKFQDSEAKLKDKDKAMQEMAARSDRNIKRTASPNKDRIAGDLLKNLLETEKSLKKTKFQRDKLDEDLLKSKKEYAENIGLLYSIIYDCYASEYTIIDKK